jgi:hypothetical protein
LHGGVRVALLDGRQDAGNVGHEVKHNRRGEDRLAIKAARQMTPYGAKSINRAVTDVRVAELVSEESRQEVRWTSDEEEPGQNPFVAGGLFVNNGFVADCGPIPGSVIVDFGALYKGAGTNFVLIVTQNGGKMQAGNSPGSMGFGKFVFGPGGVNNYVFAIDNATGTAGPSPDAQGLVSGWGLIKAVKAQYGATTTSGDFVWTATPGDKLTFALDTLVNPTMVGTDVGGPMASFDPAQSYAWPAVHWDGTYSGPTDAASLTASTAFDTSGFVNAVAGTFEWNLDPAGQTLSLTYTPTAVPEPGTLALVGVTAIGWVTFWRRRWHSNGPSATLSA